jgi:hypothetical protein
MSRRALVDALRAATVPLIGGRAPGTGFRVTPDLIVTCAHVVEPNSPAYIATTSTSTHSIQAVEIPRTRDPVVDLVLLRSVDRGDHVLLGEQVQPGDELWTFGFPTGNYREGASVALRAEGPANRDGNMLLKADGRVGRGHSGSPVLNWRTGAVCGVVAMRGTATPTVWLIPIGSLLAHYPELRAAARATAWLDLLDDSQLAASGLPHPGPQLRAYLTEVSAADEDHPYSRHLGTTTALHKVYQHQRVTSLHDGENAAVPMAEPADEVIDRCVGAQIVGNPGTGKSSLVRHIAAEKARRWLATGSGDSVPLPLHVHALTQRGGLTESLASGIQDFLHLTLDRETLIKLFRAPPLPGVPWLILADGLDEILDTQIRDLAISKINQYRRDDRFRFVLTTRPLPHALVKLSNREQYPTYVIEPFTRTELVSLCKDWLHEFDDSDPAGNAQLFVDRLERTRLRELAATPLIATMLCMLHARNPGSDLPLNQAQLYEQFIYGLLLAKSQDWLPIGSVRDRLRAWATHTGSTAEHAVDRLVDDLPNMLRELAFERQQLERYSRAFSAVAARARRRQQERWPRQLSARDREALTTAAFQASGLLVEHQRGKFSFIHQSIEEYLAAELIVDHFPDPGSRSARELLAPQREWPWSHLEIRKFVAARWIARERPPLRALTLLLSRRYSAINFRFVLDLHHQGVQLPSSVLTMAMSVLAEQIVDSDTSNRDWADATDALRILNPDRAVVALEQVLQRRMSPYRQREAAVRLSMINRESGTWWLTKLAKDGAREPTDRLLAAKALHMIPDAGAVALLAVLAADTQMLKLRVEAADLVYQTNRSCGAGLLRDIACDAHVRGVAHDRVRLAAARVLVGRDPAVGLSCLTALGRESGLDADVRFAAATTVRLQAPVIGTAIMLDIANDSSIATDVQTRAAAEAAEDGDPGGARRLTAIARDPHVATASRLRAGEELARVDKPTGLRLLLELIIHPSMGENALDAAHAAASLDQPATAQALHQLSTLDAVDAERRLKAAKAAVGLSKVEGVAALRGLSTSQVKHSVAVRAASALAEYEPDQAADLLETMARRTPGWLFDDRLDAAVQLSRVATSRGWPLLTKLLASLPERRRVAMAVKVADVVPAAGNDLLINIANDRHNADNTRIRATQVLEQRSPHRARTCWRLLAEPGVLGPAGRQQAERAVATFDPTMAKRIAESHSEPINSIEEAKRLRGRRRRLEAFWAIAVDSSADPRTRIDALERAAKIDGAATATVARELNKDHRLSGAQRKKAARIATRYG